MPSKPATQVRYEPRLGARPWLKSIRLQVPVPFPDSAAMLVQAGAETR